VSEERLQKVLARAGFGSRRRCEELITSRRVLVNGEVPILGAKVDLERDEVILDGTRVVVSDANVYYLLNKPVGILTTASDPQRRKTVMSLVPKNPRVFSVGRLDMNTEGLLLLTNDGTFAHQLQHPSFGIEKEYLVELAETPSDSAISQLRKGIELDDGLTAPARVSRVGDKGLRIVIHEGRNRQVRRMCEEVGYNIKRLVRTRIGSIVDQKLRPGEWRDLKPQEVHELMISATTGPKTRAIKRSRRTKVAG
jgi:23S rRNA pseudouridine2605 synthase